jgi:hypothetical protein
MLNYLMLFCAYAVSISLAELTFGNRQFPFHLWVYEKATPIEWSLPVHLAGFFWIIIWNRILSNKPFILAVMVCMLFFTAAEGLNYCCLKWFAYTGGFLGRPGALALILLLYGILCVCMIYILRTVMAAKTS